MTRRETVDVAILGAGPSGSCAALRLLRLGYRVAVIERLPFPRPQIGEALSPGLWTLLEFISATSALEEVSFVKDVPTRIVWEQRTPVLVPTQQHRPGILVDRGQLDARLVRLAVNAGVILLQPARAQQLDGEPGAWRLLVTGPEQAVSLKARLVLDARGRAGPARYRYATSPATVALWAALAGSVLPRETCIEASERGWLWGAPLPDGHYRLMAFVDPSALEGSAGVEPLFRHLVAHSVLFAAAAPSPFCSPVRTCLATSYLDTESWAQGLMKIGENALALDPLSSSGVEKSMRIALQAVVAANTLLRHPESCELVRSYYESCLVSSAATHILWARDHYGRAWPGPACSFWRERSCSFPDRGREQHPLLAHLREACRSQPQQEAENELSLPTQKERGEVSAETLRALWEAPVRLAPGLRFVEVPCVVKDCLELRLAVAHPRLARPVAFLAGYDLLPLLQATRTAPSLGRLVALWSSRMALPEAARIAGWLRQHGLIETGIP